MVIGQGKMLSMKRILTSSVTFCVVFNFFKYLPPPCNSSNKFTTLAGANLLLIKLKNSLKFVSKLKHCNVYDEKQNWMEKSFAASKSYFCLFTSNNAQFTRSSLKVCLFIKTVTPGVTFSCKMLLHLSRFWCNCNERALNLEN